MIALALLGGACKRDASAVAPPIDASAVAPSTVASPKSAPSLAPPPEVCARYHASLRDGGPPFALAREYCAVVTTNDGCCIAHDGSWAWNCNNAAYLEWILACPAPR